VFAFLARGALAQELATFGIEIFGPFLPRPPRWLVALKARTARLAAKLKWFLYVVVAAAMPKRMRRAIRAAWRTWRTQLSNLAAGIIALVGNLLPRRLLRFFRSASVWPTYVLIGLGLAPHIRARDIDVIHTVLPNSYVVGSVANFWFNRRPLIMS